MSDSEMRELEMSDSEVSESETGGEKMSGSNANDYSPQLQQIITKLDELNTILARAHGLAVPDFNFAAADGYIWDSEGIAFQPVTKIDHLDLKLLVGIESQAEQLYENTHRFAAGRPANNALLWGARGMGKSSLIKSVHAAVNHHLEADRRLKLIEIHREDLHQLSRLLSGLGAQPHRVILFCDDLSFDLGDNSYKPLKTLLEGGIEGRPQNLIIYATSNRKHLIAREMVENESSSAIDAGEAVHEKISLSDRFGLWLGFYGCDQDDFLTMIRNYAVAFGIEMTSDELETRAKLWAMTRGSRSGRVAWQFIQDLVGELGTTKV